MAVYNHYKRIYHGSLKKDPERSKIEDDDDNVDLDKSNVLLMGPTGSGMIIKILLYLTIILAFESYFLLLSSFLLFSQLLKTFCETGKTLLAKTLARFVNVPFVIADATTLTQVSQFLIYIQRHIIV